MTARFAHRFAAGMGMGGWCVLVAAQPAASFEAPPTSAPASELTLAGQIEVARLVDVAARRLNLTIEYDAAALKALGSVTLRLDASLGDQELWLLVNRVLAARGYTTVRLGDAPGGPAPTVHTTLSISLGRSSSRCGGGRSAAELGSAAVTANASGAGGRYPNDECGHTRL